MKALHAIDLKAYRYLVYLRGAGGGGGGGLKHGKLRSHGALICMQHDGLGNTTWRKIK